MLELITRFLRDEEGQGLAEYALILVLIAVVVIGALTILGDEIKDVFNRITGKLRDLPEGD
jgi:pilus assembly protein Flp/PilA